MRQVVMFVAGFAFVAVAGAAVAQSGVLAGDGATAGDAGVTVATEPKFPVDRTSDGGSGASDPVAATPRLAVAGTDEENASEKAEDAATEPSDVSAKEGTDEPVVEAVESHPFHFAVLHPKQGAEVEMAEVVFEGTVTPGAHVWSGDHVAVVGEDGGWRLVVPVVRGKNLVHIGAMLDDTSRTLQWTVYHGDPLVWSITQKVKTSETPFEKFYGTGTPGMVITATSTFGSGKTTIGEGGEWALGLEFDSKPGTVFPITVSTSTGWTETYTFTHVGRSVNREWAITQKFAENTEPYTKFYGTGPAGTTIVARSEYGSADARIGEHGEWVLEVWFEGVPAGTAIPVRVTNSLGFDRTYTFVWSGQSFWVEQQYGSCREEPPYDVFWGRTAPFSVVEIWSPYGGTRIEVGESGTWERKVVFEGAPVGVTFEVVVGDSHGNRKTFTFTRLANDG